MLFYNTSFKKCTILRCKVNNFFDKMNFFIKKNAFFVKKFAFLEKKHYICTDFLTKTRN